MEVYATAGEIREALGLEYADLSTRAEQLEGAGARAPAKVETEEGATKMTAFIKQLNAHIRNTENARVKAKAPYLEGGRTVDAFFSGLASQVSLVKRKCTQLLTDYQREKARKEREAREAAAREERERQRAAAEAARKAEQEAKAAQDIDAAVKAREQQRQAEAAAAEAERKSEVPEEKLGTVAAGATKARMRSTWVCSSFDRNTLDLEALRHHLTAPAIEQAIKAYIRAGNRTLKGAVIEEKHSTVVR